MLLKNKYNKIQFCRTCFSFTCNERLAVGLQCCNWWSCCYWWRSLWAEGGRPTRRRSRAKHECQSNLCNPVVPKTRGKKRSFGRPAERPVLDKLVKTPWVLNEQATRVSLRIFWGTKILFFGITFIYDCKFRRRNLSLIWKQDLYYLQFYIGI